METRWVKSHLYFFYQTLQKIKIYSKSLKLPISHLFYELMEGSRSDNQHYENPKSEQLLFPKFVYDKISDCH